MAKRNDGSVPLASLDPTEASTKFQAIWSSTFSIIQERNRLAHEIASSTDTSDHAFLRTFPYFSRDKIIEKHLGTLMEALNTWKARNALKGDDINDVPTSDQCNNWTASVAQLTDLLGQAHQILNDPRGCEILQQLRTKYPHVCEPHSAHTQPDDNEDVELPKDHLSRSDVFQYVDTMKSDDLDMGKPLPSLDEREVAAHLAQNKAWEEQDAHLDNLSASISRQHNLSLQMNEELELQTGLLHELDQDVEATGLRLGGANTRMDRFRQSLKDQGMRNHTYRQVHYG
ncbi:hypothetical protein ACI68E_001557 [Malassezia pachydermatis]|uniref:Syntaxin-like protein n=1 Tax=Malassezia pachydermatis TaxID=77020 RepID=A0A0M8MSW7_9BASI|nr:syntaxin-like protein [Malassezia pachydermatis]KOS16097.1 syntaxin-like protein [Malassezia pachydermatis]